MNEIHTNICSDAPAPQKDEARQGLLCGDKASLYTNPTLSRDTLEALEELGAVLKSIRRRMYTEGYEVVNGVVQKCI